MTAIELWLLAVGLAMDCFTVAIASGIYLKKLVWRIILTTAFCFGLFQGVMPFIGWLGTKHFSHLIESCDHWIAFLLLAFLGGKMLYESFKKDEEKHYNLNSLRIILALSVATSIDALAVGVSFAFIGMRSCMDILPAVGIIGFVSFILSIIGLIFGVKCGCGIARKIKAELLGGIILVIIGIKILIEHLYFT